MLVHLHAPLRPFGTSAPRRRAVDVPNGGRSQPARYPSAVPPFDDVAVLHDVVLALDPGAASGAGLGDGARSDQVLVVDHLGLDELLLEVGVDDARGMGRERTLRDRPGPR